MYKKEGDVFFAKILKFRPRQGVPVFDRVLIANRGEIACRIIRTARRMGLETVAVFSDADRDTLHVEMADHAVHIGGAAAADSYLRGEAIIQAARQSSAGAIHPGYGFLSENPDFVTAVEAAGLVFVGPSADSIRALGLKDAAKTLMDAAGVPVVPGYHQAAQDEDLLAAEAAGIGYPVLIKAVAGGGGKGMRRVEGPADFSRNLAHARAEAQAAFGNDAVLIEKYIETPRHIEVQVFGDGTDAVHLFERDCSLQRRHQKVIEEAPAPGMSDEMRAAMGAAAVQAARAVRYSGAGTVEFIVDARDGLRPDRFWFMEMNTRLQVEHPVTELITGVDLVEWQLRVAAGERLPKSQDELTITGHAVEARIYAEDPANAFLPATGVLERLEFPDDLRVDSGVREGDAISPYYDPMIAKLISHGETREIALARLRRGLAHSTLAGTVTNLDFLAALCAHPEVCAGTPDTGLIARDLAPLTAEVAPDDVVLGLAAIVAAGLGAGVPADEGAAWQAGFNLWQVTGQDIALQYGETRLSACLRVLAADRVDVGIGARQICFCYRGQSWWADGQKTGARVLLLANEVVIHRGRAYRFQRIDPLQRGQAVAGSGNVLNSPMPGMLKAVLVEPGTRILQGDRLAVLEAMKMEHVLSAPRDGVIAEILTPAGTQVDSGAPLIRFEDEENA